jgi:VWFA-related protein
MRRVSVFVLVLTCSTWLIARGQDAPLPAHAKTPAPQSDARPRSQPPTFRSGVALVQIDVNVLDDHRRPVKDLTAADFTVFEDGVERPVIAFTAVALPSGRSAAGAIGPAATPAVATSTASASHRDAAVTGVTRTADSSDDDDTPGRLITVVLDRSTPPGWPTVTAKHIADAVVDQLGPRDRAAVLYTSVGTPQDFTNDRRLLHATIARSNPSAVLIDDAQSIPEDSPLSNSPISRVNQSAPELKADPLLTGDCYCGLCVPETIAHVAEVIRDQPQRKVLFFVGHSMELQSARGDCGFLLRKARERMVRAIDVANLTVHVLDPVGLEVPPPAGGAWLRLDNERLAALMMIPDYTGGRIVRNNAPWALVPSIFAESASYYLLAIQPAHSTADGSYHRLRVKVARRDVHVHARKGYYATQ